MVAKIHRYPASLGFWDSLQKYNGKKVIQIKLEFWDNARK